MSKISRKQSGKETKKKKKRKETKRDKKYHTGKKVSAVEGHLDQNMS